MIKDINHNIEVNVDSIMVRKFIIIMVIIIIIY